MNLKIRDLIRGLFLALAIGSTVALSACHYTPEQRANWVTSKISSKLDLNADQKAKLETVKVAMLEAAKAHKAESEKHFGEIKEMIMADHLNAGKVKIMMAQRQKYIDANFDPIFAKVAAFHESLTPEQKKKAVDLLDKLKEEWGGE